MEEQPKLRKTVSMVLVTFYSAVDEEIDCEGLVASALRRLVECGECEAPIEGWDIQVILKPTETEVEGVIDEDFGLVQEIKKGPPF